MSSGVVRSRLDSCRGSAVATLSRCLLTMAPAVLRWGVSASICRSCSSRHSRRSAANTPVGSKCCSRCSTASTSSISISGRRRASSISSGFWVSLPLASTASMKARAMAKSVSENRVRFNCQRSWSCSVSGSVSRSANWPPSPSVPEAGGAEDGIKSSHRVSTGSSSPMSPSGVASVKSTSESDRGSSGCSSSSRSSRGLVSRVSSIACCKSSVLSCNSLMACCSWGVSASDWPIFNCSDCFITPLADANYSATGFSLASPHRFPQ